MPQYGVQETETGSQEDMTNKAKYTDGGKIIVQTSDV